nr:heavy-metal-associated domain-containing protein [Veillonella denticariosi]
MEETLLLQDLNCANCAAKIEDRIRKMDGIETANFAIATHQLKLTGSWSDREALKQDIQDICDAIEEGVTVLITNVNPRRLWTITGIVMITVAMPLRLPLSWRAYYSWPMKR